MKKKPFEKTPEIIFMRKVSKDIINMFNKETSGKLTLEQCYDKFYKIMRKHGITQGEWSQNGAGRIVSNFEWTACMNIFKESIMSWFFWRGLIEEVPKDLMGYGKIE